MAVPKYFEMYRAFLECLSDGQVHTIKDAKVAVTEAFSLTDNDLSQMLASGKQTVFDNRIGWCRTYLKKANLIVSPARAKFVITEEGKKLIATSGDINDDILMQYPDFVKFKKGDSENGTQTTSELPIPISNNDMTPQETLEQAYKVLNDTLADDLLKEILQMDPYKFEALVVDLLVKMGYGKMQYDSGATKKSGDEGIDGVVTADKLGFDSIYIQAKRYKDGSVGRPEIQRFVGALAGQGAQKGIFITTSKFTKEAEDFAAKNLSYKVVLVDGKKLSDLMIEFGLGVSIENTYYVKRIDSDYFEE